MRRPLSALAAAVVLALTGCGAAPAPIVAPSSSQASATPASGNAEQLLARLNLTGKTAQQVIESLDQDTRSRPLPMRASVRTDSVVLSDEQGETSLPIAGEKSFYLAIAPFVNRTHDCFFHSLATCQGELVGTPVQVRITDTNGAVLVDETRTTYTNGFVSFWLPRDLSGTVTVTADGKTGSVPFATKADSPTCLTTLKLG